jgi:MFS family permease
MRAAGASGQPCGMTTSTDRLFTPAFIALTLSELAYFAAGGLVIGVTPFYVTGPVGSDEAGLGLTFGAFSIATLVLRPYAGRLADRRGRRPLLLLGASLAAVVLLLHTITDDLIVLVALRMLLGVAEAFYFVAGFAALADLAPPSRVGEALSFNSLALYLGIAIGPVVGEALIDQGGFGAAWLGGFGLLLIAVALAMRVPETAPAMTMAMARTAPPAPLIHRAAVGPGIALFTGIVAMTGFFLLGGQRAERLGLEAWSVAFLVFGGVVVAGRIAFARLPDRLPPIRVITIALTLCAAGSALAALAVTISVLLVAAAILAIGVALITPAVFVAIFRVVPAAERGAAAGTATIFIDLAFGAGPLVLGIVAASAGGDAAFWVAALIAMTGAAGSLVISRSTRWAIAAT